MDVAQCCRGVAGCRGEDLCYSCIMAILIMMVSLAVHTFENFGLLVDSNLVLLGRTAGTYLWEGHNLKAEFRWRFSNPGYRSLLFWGCN